MALAVPKLDDRQFQDIVDEAKKRIPHYCPEWTDHNVSDPGVTLIELFAWMTDVLLYRLNQVPDLHYVKLLEMLGITLREPEPASVPITFWLAAPQPAPVVIPAGTEVASTQTETQPSIVFTTDDDLRVEPPLLAAVSSRLISGDGQKARYRDHDLRRLEVGFSGVQAFSAVPRVNDALYFGFKNDLSQRIVGLELDNDPAKGAGIRPTRPPWAWEASSGDGGWEPCEVESDTTRGMEGPGRIRLFVPRMGSRRIRNQDLYWVRARIIVDRESEADEDLPPYVTTPVVRKVAAATWGGCVAATHARQAVRELLGQSDGSPGQRFALQFTPVLRRGAGERLTVMAEGEPPQGWTEVTGFSGSGSGDRHYTLNGTSGELRFGPAIRQPDGTLKLYGAVPPRGSHLVFDRYRHGGGREGNVQAGVLNTLKTAIPYVARVSNRQPAQGGLDAESLEAAKMRAPAMLRSRERAVTEDDYEFLACLARPAAIGRVKCLQPRPSEAGRVAPGQIYVLVIPRVAEAGGYLAPDQLELGDGDTAALAAYLDERRLLTTQLNIRPPVYHWVVAKATLRASPGADEAEVRKEVLRRRHRYLNPLTGGPEGMGWPFGRYLFLSDVYQCLQGLPDVQFIRSVEMYAADEGGGARGEALDQLEVVAHGVVASGHHAVKFV